MGPVVDTVGPYVPITSRAGVLLGSLCYIRRSKCCILIILSLGGGVFFSLFSRVLSKWESGSSSGLAGHVGPSSCGFPLSVGYRVRVPTPLSCGVGAVRSCPLSLYSVSPFDCVLFLGGCHGPSSFVAPSPV